MMLEAKSQYAVSRYIGYSVNDCSPLSGLTDWNPLPVEILAQPVVKLGQAAEFQVGHALLILLDLSRVADVSGCVLRHLVGVLEFW